MIKNNGKNMSKDIKHFINQVGTDTSGKWISVDKMEQLTELIVEECGDVAYNAYWENPETVRGIHIKEKIKQHFGIK